MLASPRLREQDGAHQLEAPDVSQELLLREHASRLGGEHTQERELLRRELDLAVAERDVPRDRVDRELADPEQAARAALARAPQDGSDPSRDLRVVEGLFRLYSKTDQLFGPIPIGNRGPASERIGTPQESA